MLLNLFPINQNVKGAGQCQLLKPALKKSCPLDTSYFLPVYYLLNVFLIPWSKKASCLYYARKRNCCYYFSNAEKLIYTQNLRKQIGC